MNHRRIDFVAATILVCVVRCAAQELEPRAYSVSPTGANFGVVGFARSAGDVDFDPSLPIEDAHAVLYGTFLTRTGAPWTSSDAPRTSPSLSRISGETWRARSTAFLNRPIGRDSRTQPYGSPSTSTAHQPWISNSSPSTARKPTLGQALSSWLLLASTTQRGS